MRQNNNPVVREADVSIAISDRVCTWNSTCAIVMHTPVMHRYVTITPYGGIVNTHTSSGYVTITPYTCIVNTHTLWASGYVTITPYGSIVNTHIQWLSDDHAIHLYCEQSHCTGHHDYTGHYQNSVLCISQRPTESYSGWASRLETRTLLRPRMSSL